MLNHRYEKILKFATIVLCFILTSRGFSMEKNDPNELIEKHLAQIKASNKGYLTTDYNALEAQGLVLLKDYNSQAQKGIIYAALAHLYSDKGFPPKEKGGNIHVLKTKSFSQKALEYPLEPLVACEMYGKLTSAMLRGLQDKPKDEFAKIRSEAIVPCLKGLKIALDNNTPDEIKPPPGVEKYHIDAPGTEVDLIKIKQQMQMSARKKWELDKNFYIQKVGLEGMCIAMYSKDQNIEEFKQFAQDIIKGHQDEIEKIAADIKKGYPSILDKMKK